MRLFLINKNLSLYYWLKKRIGRKWACRVALIMESGILIFGRPKLKEGSSREEPTALQSCHPDIKR